MIMEILVNASAPNRATAIATMVALGIADENLTPLVQVHIFEVPIEGSRSLWNLWYYGDSAQALMKPEPEGGWLPEHDLFDRTYILEMVDSRTGIAMEWTPIIGEAGEPPGFETPTGVRLYDPAIVATPSLVKQ